MCEQLKFQLWDRHVLEEGSAGTDPKESNENLVAEISKSVPGPVYEDSAI